MNNWSRLGVLSLMGLAIIGGLLILLYGIFLVEVAVLKNNLSLPITWSHQVLVPRNHAPTVADLTMTLDKALTERAIRVSVDTVTFDTSSDELSLSVSPSQLLNAARIDISEFGPRGFFAWIKTWFQEVRVKDYVTWDQSLVNELIADWEETLGIHPATSGDIEIITTPTMSIQVVPPQAGASLDSEMLLSLIVPALGQSGRGDTVNIDLPISVVDPRNQLEKLEVLANDLRSLLGQTINWRTGSETISLMSGEELLGLITVYSDSPDGGYQTVIDKDVFIESVGLTQEQPKNARFVEDNLNIKIEPSLSGVAVNMEATVDNLWRAVRKGSNDPEIVTEQLAAPEVTTTDLEDLGIKHLLARFTTYHPCCQERVTNIQTMADTINGYVLLPGDTFSLNSVIGERTLEKGYQPAPSIEQRELIDTVGGGVSQLATTLYNAVFWSGLEDVTHAPHSRYFSRYPEGIEATVSWPVPNLIFRNNYETPIVIMTSHTDGSISISVWGDNDGRVWMGEQRSGQTIQTLVEAGGEQARSVEGWVSDRYNQSNPGTDYIADRTIPRGGIELEQTGSSGWDVTVTRDITQAGNNLAHNTWIVHYYPVPNLVRVHPCDLPEEATVVEGDPVCHQ